MKSRKAKFDFFISVMQPRPQDSILDIGVSPFVGRWTNFMEIWYPHQDRVTVLGAEDKDKYSNFLNTFPAVKLICADARKLDFPDNSFSIAFSNAVIEHVGDDNAQRAFVREIMRVAKKAFITGPYRWFPVDSHTLLPFVHYLPPKLQEMIYKKLSGKADAAIPRVNLLTVKKFISFFPEGVKVRLYKQRTIGLTRNLIAVAERQG